MNDSKPPRHVLDPERAIRLAHETLEIEAAAVQGLRQRLDASFARAVELMLQVSGRVVVMGMGKSGHIGRKTAATLASTGTPAMFFEDGTRVPGALELAGIEERLKKAEKS